MYSSRISFEERKINDLDEIFVCVCFFFLNQERKRTCEYMLLSLHNEEKEIEG